MPKVFAGPGPVKPPHRFLVFPPRCVDISNVVTQTRFNMTVSGDKIMLAYPFCRRNSKNWRAVLMKTENPDATASIYDMGMMILTGCNSVHASRYAADMFTDLIRAAGYPDLKIIDFKVINLTTTFAFGSAFDAAKYRREVDSTLNYVPCGFVGARTYGDRTRALITLFTKNGTALGTRDMPNLCLDVRDQLKRMQPCMVPLGTEEEKELEVRIVKQRKREVPSAPQVPEEEEETKRLKIDPLTTPHE